MSAFLDAMRAKWAEYGNVESPALRHVWLQMQATLDYQSGPDALDVWPVIPCELGSGKTTAAKVWCAVKPFDQNHPGVLIVVRTKDQADEYARDINAWSGVPHMAFAHHSGLPLSNRQNLDVLASYPVLVVCHKSYENGLDDFAVDVSRTKCEKMHQFRRRGSDHLNQRGLVIIDESLDQVHEERLRRDVLKELMGRMPRAVEKAHPEAMRVIESINRVLREAPDERHRTFSTQELLALTPFTADQADGLPAGHVGAWHPAREAARARAPRPPGPDALGPAPAPRRLPVDRRQRRADGALRPPPSAHAARDPRRGVRRDGAPQQRLHGQAGRVRRPPRDPGPRLLHGDHLRGAHQRHRQDDGQDEGRQAGGRHRGRASRALRRPGQRAARAGRRRPSRRGRLQEGGRGRWLRRLRRRALEQDRR